MLLINLIYTFFLFPSNHRFKCCKQDATTETANLPLPIAPEEPLKVEETEEITEEIEAETKAADASYKCCGVW